MRENLHTNEKKLMHKYYIGLSLAFIFNLSAASAAVAIDSIGVENLNGKKLIIHKVVQNDTYYSLSRRYSVSPKEIMTYNDNKYLQIGVIIKVPTQRAFTENVASTAGMRYPQSANSQEPTFSEHVVQKKENLNMLAKKYGTTIEEIKSINNLSSINLSIGQVLKMPIIASPVAATQTSVDTAKKIRENVIPAKKINPIVNQPPPVKPVPVVEAPFEELLVHMVKANETMYSIATTYKLSMDQLKAKNKLTTNSLRIGQRLLIRGEYGRINPEDTVDNELDTLTSIRDPRLKLPPSRYGLSQIDERGTALYIMDPGLDPSKMLVLHRTAPIGAVIKITNPMSNRSTFAKVVGKFAENANTKDVIIVMTKAVADALGALDKRFFCNITYSGQDSNEQ